MQVHTWGYSGRTLAHLQQFVQEVNGVVIDCRLAPWTGYSGFHRDTLQAAFRTRYRWVKGFGNLNHTDSRAAVDLAAPRSGMDELDRMLNRSPGRSPILLCACKDVRFCHLMDVAKFLGQNYHEEVDLSRVTPSKPQAKPNPQLLLF